MRFPATAPISNTSSASLRSRVSKTQLARGSTEAACQFSWGRGRQAMHLPCKQAYVGALPTDSTTFNCGENQIQVSFISSASVGATPTPATINIWEMIRLPDCKSGVTKQGRKRRLARYQHFPPFWIRSSIRGATRCLREG